MIPRLAGVVAALLSAAAVTACSSSSGPVSPGPGRSAATQALLRAAHLRPCPPSSARAVRGGLPDVTLSCLGHGPAVHLAGLTGRPTVVNIWGSWCIPCQSEAAYLSSVYDAEHGKVRFLGVDTEDSVDSALSFGMHVRPPLRYPSVVDPQKKVLIGVHAAPGPPVTLFVDAAGKIVHVHPGEYTSAAALRSDVATYLRVK